MGEGQAEAMSNTTNAQSMEREHIRREIIDDLDEEF